MREPLSMDGGTTFTFVTDGIASALAQAKEAAGWSEISIAPGPYVRIPAERSSPLPGIWNFWSSGHGAYGMICRAIMGPSDDRPGPRGRVRTG
jgi:hypothetical protein